MEIGIDIGGSHIASAIIENNKIVKKVSRDINISNENIEKDEKTEEKEVMKFLLGTIKNEIDELIKNSKFKIEDLLKIGIAVPGSPSNGKIKNAVNLHIKEINIVKELKKTYNVDIVLKNDGKCAGLAEKKYGALKKYKDCVFLCIGTGVGSAVFKDEKLLEAKNTPGFELGHMIINKNGIKCNCGNNGCFETFASMKRFKERVIKELKLKENFGNKMPNIPSEEFQNFIRKNIKNEDINDLEVQKKVKQIVDEYLEDVAIGLANIINIFEPEAICFGGSFSYYDDIFLPILKEKIIKYQFNKETEIKLVTAKLKNDAGLLGATIFE